MERQKYKKKKKDNTTKRNKIKIIISWNLYLLILFYSNFILCLICCH